MTTNICRNAAAIAFRLGGRITTGTPFRPQNVYRNGVPVRSGTTTPLHASTPTLIIPTKFEVDMTIHCRVTVFLFDDTSRDLVTLTFDLLTLNSCLTWRVTWPTLPPSLKILRLFVHELRVITVPIDYHRKCVRSHCACTNHVTRD